MTLRCVSRGIVALSLVTVSTAALSATMIRFKDDSEGVSSEIWVSGPKARVNQPEDGGYMIMDLKANRQYMVSDQEKRVIDMTDMAQGMKGMIGDAVPHEQPPLDLKVEKKGKGPEIVGFATERYIVSVGDEVCFEEFLSPQALRTGDIKHFTDAMAVMSDGLADVGAEPCDRAEAEMAKRYGSLGVPLRSLDAEGSVIHEVTTLNVNFDPPPGAFDFPAGYQRTTLQEVMQEMMRNGPPGMTMPPND